MEKGLSWRKQRAGYRIYQFLQRLEEESVFDFSEDAPYTESILSIEVKKYFTQLAMQGSDENNPEQDNSILQQIFTKLQLDSFEQMCVELAVLGEVNPYFEKFYIYMNNDWNSGYLTPDTSIKLYTLKQDNDADFYHYFSPKGRLLRYFFKFTGQEGKSRARWGLKCREHFFSFLFGDSSRPFEELSFVKWCNEEAEMDELFPDLPVFNRLDAVIGQNPPGIYLYGMKDSDGVQMVAQYSRKCAHEICFLDIRRLVYMLDKNLPDETLEEICNDIHLQLIIKNAWICLYSINSEFWEKEMNRQVTTVLIESFQGAGNVLFIIGEQFVNLAKDCTGIWELSMEKQDVGGNLQAWERCGAAYSMEEKIGLPFFASTYHFTPVQIERIFKNAERQRVLKGNSVIRREDIKKSCIRETGTGGNHMVTVMNTGYQWEDLVLPDRQKELLKAACNRVLYRNQIYDTWGFGRMVPYGRGVSMVFTGAPGTGKTMSAGIVADYLGTTLYRVDLAAVVSKYIGETEKNLSIIFETVKKGNGVLFFDEADVLFSKRTEVSNSNDKHSNMEAAYLLQKMEEYEGIVILATNYMQNMDEAFKRRIQFVIDFPIPDKAGRRMLWEKNFPEQIEFDEVPDYDFLAGQFELSGSHIKNIALQAAFFAADEKKGVSMEHVIRALLLEMRKTGKTISREDLREYYIYYE